MDGYRIIPDGKPYSKGEKGWYKLDGCEHWMLWESTMDGNATTPATAPFIGNALERKMKNDIKRN